MHLHKKQEPKPDHQTPINNTKYTTQSTQE